MGRTAPARPAVAPARLPASTHAPHPPPARRRLPHLKTALAAAGARVLLMPAGSAGADENERFFREGARARFTTAPLRVNAVVLSSPGYANSFRRRYGHHLFGLG